MEGNMIPLKQEAMETAIKWRLETSWDLDTIRSMLVWKFGDFTDDLDEIIPPAMEMVSSPLFAAMKEE
jgi:hypothetical protein